MLTDTVGSPVIGSALNTGRHEPKNSNRRFMAFCSRESTSWAMALPSNCTKTCWFYGISVTEFPLRNFRNAKIRQKKETTKCFYLFNTFHKKNVEIAYHLSLLRVIFLIVSYLTSDKHPSSLSLLVTSCHFSLPATFRPATYRVTPLYLPGNALVGAG